MTILIWTVWASLWAKQTKEEYLCFFAGIPLIPTEPALISPGKPSPPMFISIVILDIKLALCSLYLRTLKQLPVLVIPSPLENPAVTFVSLSSCLLDQRATFSDGFCIWSVSVPFQLAQIMRMPPSFLPRICCCSASVLSSSLWPHGLQHTRPPCPSLSPRVYSNSCPLSRWCHPTISSFVVPFSCLQSCLVSGSFPVNEFFTSGGQSVGASASALVLPMNIHSWFPLGWTGLISKGLSRVFSNTTFQKHQFFGAQPSIWSNSHIRPWLLEKAQL